jgi:hypothetical protein
LNRLSELLLLIIKISKIRKKPNTIWKLTPLAMSCKNWGKFVKTRRRTTRLKIGNCRKILTEKIEFEYYIFNVFLIAAKCILLNNSASFQHLSFKRDHIVELGKINTQKLTLKNLGKINTQRCSVTLITFSRSAMQRLCMGNVSMASYHKLY